MNFCVKEKFAPVIQHFEEIVTNSRRLGGCCQHWLFCSISWSYCDIKTGKKRMKYTCLYILVDASCLLGLPILATEQYPRYFKSILTNKLVRGFDIYQFILSQGSGCNSWSSQIEGDGKWMYSNHSHFINLINTSETFDGHKEDFANIVLTWSAN